MVATMGAAPSAFLFFERQNKAVFPLLGILEKRGLRPLDIIQEVGVAIGTEETGTSMVRMEAPGECKRPLGLLPRGGNSNTAYHWVCALHGPLPVWVPVSCPVKGRWSPALSMA